MDITNVTIEEGYSDRFTVTAEDLAYFDNVPLEVTSALSKKAFFLFALDYIESTEEGVIDTEYAKIDGWFPVKD